MAYIMCPYYNHNSKTCTPLGTKPAEHTRQTKCLSAEEWMKCANFVTLSKKK